MDGDQDMYQIPVTNAKRRHRPFNPQERSHYSEKLLQMIEKCIRYRPGDRPDMDELYFDIAEKTRGLEGPARGLRSAPCDDPGFLTMGIPGLKDEYALRATLPSDFEPVTTMPSEEGEGSVASGAKNSKAAV